MRKHLLLAALLPAIATRAQTATFQPVVTYPTATGSNLSTYGLAVADLTADGKPDAVTLITNYVTYACQVAVLPGTGTGAFQAPTYYSVGRGDKHLAVADLNADGKPDVVAADEFDGQVSVLLGGSAGTLLPAVAYSTGAGTSPSELAVADLNADGKPDVVVTLLQDAVAVLLGNGNGTFQPVASYSTGYNTGPNRLAVADVNGDGKLDALTNSGGQYGLRVLLGTGTGALQAATSYPAGTGSFYTVAVADLNADGRPDVLTTSSTNVGVLLGNAAATLQPVVTYPVAGIVSINYLAVADMNHDGKPDVLTANFDIAGNTVSLLPGTGTGALQASVTFPVGAANCLPRSVVAADLNGDGRLDLITANLTNNTLGVLLNTTPLAARVALPGGQVQLSPNPAAATGTTLALRNLPAAVRQVQATLRDAAGRETTRLVLAASQGVARAELPTTGLAAGLYLVQLAAYDGQGELAAPLPTQRLLVP